MKMSDSNHCSFEMNDGFDDCWTETVNENVKSKIGCLFPRNYEV